MSKIIYNFKGKKVVVTGAASGLGYSIAKTFHESGADVCISDINIPKGFIEEFRSNHGHIITVETDVSNGKSVDNLVNEIKQNFGTIDVLVNNASIYPTSDFLTLTEDEWDHMLYIDLKSVFLCTKAFSNLMVSNNHGGCILNIGSIDAFHPSLGHSHYCAAKAGVHAYTLASAYELGKHGIRVNTISPGLIDRPSLKEQWPDGYYRFINKSPLKHIPTAQEIADACLFLSSDAAISISGINLPIDSGVLSAPPY